MQIKSTMRYHPTTVRIVIIKKKKKKQERLLWWFSGWESMFPMQGMQVQFLVRELSSHVPHSLKINKICFLRSS